VSPVNALVIGLGSIGQRHAHVLRELGHGVATVSRRSNGDYQSIAKAIAAGRPGYVVVATETSDHAESLRQRPGRL
jgi:predicted dehydrogenase